MFIDRIAAAKEDGFEYVEFWSWTDKDLDAVKAAAVNAGIVVNHYTEHSNTLKICSMYDMLLGCVEIIDKTGIAMNLEALNVTTDHVGNFLKHTNMAAEMTSIVDHKYLPASMV